MPRRPSDSRGQILAAAIAEFAAHGFRGATVDAIARRARLNKAMIYYHFKDKRSLYLEILRGVFSSVLDRTSAIVASPATPEEKIARFIDAFGAEADAHPYLPRLMMLEVADGARRLDPPTLRIMAGVFKNLAAILEEGLHAGVFLQANPLVTYFNIVSPTMFFRAAAPLREVLTRHALLDLRMDTETFSSHLKASAVRSLAAPREPRTARRPEPTGDER